MIKRYSPPRKKSREKKPKKEGTSGNKRVNISLHEEILVLLDNLATPLSLKRVEYISRIVTIIALCPELQSVIDTHFRRVYPKIKYTIPKSYGKPIV